MLAELRQTCDDQNEIDVAACKAHALRNAGDRLIGDAFGLMARCEEEFGTVHAKADAKKPGTKRADEPGAKPRAKPADR